MPGGLLSISLSFATIPVVTSLFQLAVVYSFAAAVYQAVRCLLLTPTCGCAQTRTDCSDRR